MSKHRTASDLRTSEPGKGKKIRTDRAALAEIAPLKLPLEVVKGMTDTVVAETLRVFRRRKNSEIGAHFTTNDLALLSRDRQIADILKKKVTVHQTLEMQSLTKELKKSRATIIAVSLVYSDFILEDPDSEKAIRREVMLQLRDIMRDMSKNGKMSAALRAAELILANTQNVAESGENTQSSAPQSIILNDFRTLDPDRLQSLVSQKLREIRATNHSAPEKH